MVMLPEPAFACPVIRMQKIFWQNPNSTTQQNNEAAGQTSVTKHISMESWRTDKLIDTYACGSAIEWMTTFSLSIHLLFTELDSKYPSDQKQRYSSFLLLLYSGMRSNNLDIPLRDQKTESKQRVPSLQCSSASSPTNSGKSRACDAKVESADAVMSKLRIYMLK